MCSTGEKVQEGRIQKGRGTDTHTQTHNLDWGQRSGLLIHTDLKNVRTMKNFKDYNPNPAEEIQTQRGRVT